MSQLLSVFAVVVVLVTSTHGIQAQEYGLPPAVLPAAAATRLQASLDSARAHRMHVWRDTPPMNADTTVNAYVEIPRGERTKWEFDIRKNERAVDRIIPEAVGGYPVNYGFVPQTISYDGDPFDVLVLGPPLRGGLLVRGAIVGVMFMEDEKGLDTKIVVSQTDASGRPLYALTSAAQRKIGDYFNSYKRFEPKAFSKVPGWGSVAEGSAYLSMTHAFFLDCRQRTSSCEVPRPREVTGARR